MGKGDNQKKEDELRALKRKRMQVKKPKEFEKLNRQIKSLEEQIAKEKSKKSDES
jgi:hypothetical protein